MWRDYLDVLKLYAVTTDMALVLPIVASTRDAKAETMNGPGARKFINNRQSGMPLIYSDESV